MTWGKTQKLANRALTEGDLDTVAGHLADVQFRQSFQGRRIARQLTAALIQRAEGATSIGNLAHAWKDLTVASEIAQPKDADSVSKHLNQLVELTIESAGEFLANGKISHAVQLIDQLGRRKILDWRADRIRNVADCLHKAEELAAAGKFTPSLESLEKAKLIQPDLSFIESRISATRLREVQMKELTEELQETALKCHWAQVNECCQKILSIAPRHQIALDAQRHCLTQIKRKTNSGLRATHVPERVSDSNSFYQFGSAANSGSAASGKPDGDTQAANSGDTVAGQNDPAHKTNSFLLWVDGVGGYLVCVDNVNTIGQAVPHANISIPIIGDLRRRHARIETLAGQHLLQGLGGVKVEDEPIQGSVELKHGQVVSLDGGVKFKYTQTHPLSKSARLDLVSRHRTQPWSDAILLASQSIVLGPNRDNHVFCPTWKMDLIIFQRKEKWFCRSKSAFEIDKVKVENEGEIQFDSQIVGEDFSLTLEPVV